MRQTIVSLLFFGIIVLCTPCLSEQLALSHAGSISDGSGSINLKYPNSVSVSGNYAFILSDNGLEIVDISIPTRPVHVANISEGNGGAKISEPSGLFIANNHAYIICQNNILEIFDISDPKLPVHKGYIRHGDGGALLNAPTAIFVLGNYAYVTSYTSESLTLEIIDISNPSVPTHVGSRTDTSYQKYPYQSQPASIYVSGNYAYVTVKDHKKLEIIDVSNPHSPVHVGVTPAYSEGGINCAGALTGSGNYTYIVGGEGSDNLNIVDVSNPYNPRRVGNLTDGQGGAHLDRPYNIVVNGDYAYIPCWGPGGIEVVNISNPAAPIHVSKMMRDINGTVLSAPWGFAIQGNYAFGCDRGWQSFFVVNISDPTHLFQERVILSGQGGASLQAPRAVARRGNYAYVADYARNSIEVVDISNPGSPRHHTTISDDPDGAALREPSAIAIDGDYAYIASRARNTIEILDITNPGSPRHHAKISDGDTEAQLLAPRAITVEGTRAYVTSEGSNALEIIDISNPGSPRHHASLSNGEGGAQLLAPRAITVEGTRAYVASEGSNALEIIDISNPAEPAHIGSISDGGEARLRRPSDVAISGDYAYVSSGEGNALEIINVARSSNPYHVASIIDGAEAKLRRPTSVKVAGPYAFVTSGDSNAVEVIDISNPAEPAHRASVSNGEGGARLGRPEHLVIMPVADPIRNVSFSRVDALEENSSGYYLFVASNESSSLEVLKFIPGTSVSINPKSGVNTAPVTVTISGSDFQSGTLVNLTNSSISIPGSVSSISNITLKCTFPITGAPPWKYQLNIRYPDGTITTKENAFTVTNATPTITAISPVSGFNAGTLPVTITGTSFRNGVFAFLVNNTTILTGTITNRTTTKILCTFPLNTTPIGLYNLTIQNADGSSVTKTNAFTVNPAGLTPMISGVTPGSGVNTGSVSLTITGTNFRPKATVTIANLSATKTVTGMVTGNTTKATLPLTGLPFGLYNVTVSNTDGSSATSAKAFTVTNPAPVIAGISPKTGYTPGSIVVTITGSKFAPGAEISLANATTALPGLITSPGQTRIIGTFNLTTLASGSYNLTVTNPGGPNATKPFTISSPDTVPVIDTIIPDTGVNTGAVPVCISGANFRKGASVTITNGTSGTTVSGTVTGNTTITCSLPLTSLPFGRYTVTVRNSDGSTVTRENFFSVTNPDPKISSILPVSGYTGSTALVTISGSKFVGGAGVSLKNASFSLPGLITSFSATKIVGTFGLESITNGTYNLMVTNPGGPNTSKPFIVLTPGSSPTISTITPGSGMNTAPVPVTITGSHFRPKATVTITNGTTTKTVSGTVTGETTITCSLPLTGFPFGRYNVTVSNTDRSSATREYFFNVTNPAPKISAVSPSTGYTNSSCMVTITGSKFAPDLKIFLENGARSLSGTITLVSATKITGTFPLTGLPAGIYNLTVSNPGNANATKPGAFTIQNQGSAPVISSINPASGFNTGNLPVIITGLNFSTPSVFLQQGELLKQATTTAGKKSTATTLYVTLPLKGIPGGYYNITVSNSDRVNTTGNGIFYVTDQAWISKAPKTIGRTPGIQQVELPSGGISPGISGDVSPSGKLVIFRAGGKTG